MATRSPQLLSLGLGLTLAIASALVVTQGAKAPPPCVRVAVDVGHSSTEPGATSARGTAEFRFNRDLAADVSHALGDLGFCANIIGNEGDADDLFARTRDAAPYDFFLSIHHDSVQPRHLAKWTHRGRVHSYSDRFSGFSLFVSRRNTAASLSARCASSIGRAMRRQGFQPSLHHAEPIAGENRPLADRANGVYFFDELVVLRTAKSAAVLVEAGIIVNRKDEIQLGLPATRQRISAAIASGLDECVRHPAAGARGQQRLGPAGVSRKTRSRKTNVELKNNLI